MSCHLYLASLAHGATPLADRPAVSGRPSIRLAHCTACPAAPLPRLSSALTTTIRPLSESTVDCRRQALEPSVAAVCGQVPAGSTWTNGSPAYAARSASESPPAGRT